MMSDPQLRDRLMSDLQVRDRLMSDPQVRDRLAGLPDSSAMGAYQFTARIWLFTSTVASGLSRDDLGSIQ